MFFSWFHTWKNVLREKNQTNKKTHVEFYIYLFVYFLGILENYPVRRSQTNLENGSQYRNNTVLSLRPNNKVNH